MHDVPKCGQRKKILTGAEPSCTPESARYDHDRRFPRRTRATPLLPDSLSSLTIAVAADPPKTPAPLPGEKMIQAYFQRQAKEIADADLRDFKTREDWEKARPELRRQLLEMLGLWPLPAADRPESERHRQGRTAEVHRREAASSSRRPGLYVTGNLYVPKPAPTKAPTVLYVCGHGNVVEGRRLVRQQGALSASPGVVRASTATSPSSSTRCNSPRSPACTTARTARRCGGGTRSGYTPAGVECWNAMRALDYLETRPEVDAKRIGVTGRSGGGAYSWWIAATDDRIACAVPVAGIADLQAHLNEGYPGTGWRRASSPATATACS